LIEGEAVKRVKPVIVTATLFGFATALSLGCGGTDVPVIKVEPAQAGPTKPLPKDVKQGGGSGSSGNMKMNPGANS